MPLAHSITAPAKSFLLLGPRGTGKSTWLAAAFPRALTIDLLDASRFLTLSRDPSGLERLVTPRRLPVFREWRRRGTRYLETQFRIRRSADRLASVRSQVIWFVPRGGEGSTNFFSLRTLTMQRRNGTFARRSRIGGAQASHRGLSLETLEQRCVPAGLSIGDAVVAEGVSGTKFVEVPVTLPAPATKSVQVDFQTVAGSARAGSDFTAVSGTLTFARGQSRQVVRVPIVGDRVPEFNESFEVVLQRPRNATIADGRGTVLIQDSSPRLSIKAATSAFDNDDGRGGTVQFTVSLSAAYDLPVTVQFQTADGLPTPGLADGAKAGEDYVAATGSLTFAPGETSKTISIQVVGDTKLEHDEMFRIFLYNATGALLLVSDASADGSISGKLGMLPGEFIG